MSEKNWIGTPEGVERLAEQLRGHEAVGIDTEFIRETTFFPRIALIQVATRDDAWLVDPVALGRDALQPLLDVLRDPQCLKIMHAAYADQECFFWSYDLVAAPVIDTAVAGALLGYGDNIGLGKLLKEVLHRHLPKGRARAKWLARPLPRELLAYAEQDVAHLVELGSVLRDALQRRDRWEWALEESEVDPKVFDVSPDDLASKMAKNGHMDAPTYSVLVELLRWREDRARKANLPRAWVADNDLLVALAKVRPSSLEELRAFRGLSPKEVERSGPAILDSVKRGRETPRELPFRPTATFEKEDHVSDFIRTYVSFLSARHEIAPRFLLNTGQAGRLSQLSEAGPDGWVREEILSSHARALIGDDLRELLAGRRALAIRNRKVEILEV